MISGFRPATESEMVLAFLRGEVDSDRFGNDVRRALVAAGGLQLVHSPDLDSEDNNRARGQALSAARGWPDTGLFKGFPQNVEWHHGALPPEVLARVRFIDYTYWNELSGGSRQPADVPAIIRSGQLPAWLTELGTDWCSQFAAQLATAESVDDLIVMATPDLDRLVLLEGHARLTAVFLAGLQERLPVRAYVGLSAEIEQWKCF